MLGQNAKEPRDVFAMELVKNHGVTLRQLQQALELSAQQVLPLDVALLEMKAVGSPALASAAKAANYVLTVEHAAELSTPEQGARAFVRHATKLAVQFDDWGNLSSTYTNNISRGGLGVTLPGSAEAPDVQSVLALSLTLPNGENMDVKARVVYSHLSGEHRHVGLQLDPSDTEIMLKIDRLLREQSA